MREEKAEKEEAHTEAEARGEGGRERGEGGRHSVFVSFFFAALCGSVVCGLLLVALSGFWGCFLGTSKVRIKNRAPAARPQRPCSKWAAFTYP